jgi:hypothetical protein
MDPRLEILIKSAIPEERETLPVAESGLTNRAPLGQKGLHVSCRQERKGMIVAGKH